MIVYVQLFTRVFSGNQLMGLKWPFWAKFARFLSWFQVTRGSKITSKRRKPANRRRKYTLLTCKKFQCGVMAIVRLSHAIVSWWHCSMDIALSVFLVLWIFYFLNYLLSQSVIKNIFYFFVEEQIDQHYEYFVMPVSGCILNKFSKILNKKWS